MFIYAREKTRNSMRSPRKNTDMLLITRRLYPTPIVRRALEAEKYDTISGDTAAIFSLNHSCLFLIANVMSSISDRSYFSQTSKIAKIHGILCVTQNDILNLNEIVIFV